MIGAHPAGVGSRKNTRRSTAVPDLQLARARQLGGAVVALPDGAEHEAGSASCRSDSAASSGAVVVDLTGSVTGGARCVSGVDEDLVRAIRRHPWRYYVNVHNAPYPGGAVRGQLRG